MNCSSCGAAVADESLGFCTECGETFGSAPSPGVEAGAEDYNQQDDGSGDYPSEDYAGEGYDNPEGYYEEPPPGPTAMEQLDQLTTTVMVPLAAVTHRVWRGFRSVLDAPVLRGLLPGGSLTLLGLGLVGVGLLLSAIPGVAGLGQVGTGVVVVWGLLAAMNEWYVITYTQLELGRPVWAMPDGLLNLPREVWHPVTAWLFALLTWTYALRGLGSGFVAVVLLLAAVLIGYEQGQRYFLGPREEGDEALEGAPLGRYRWAVVGAVVCSLSLLLPWGRERVSTVSSSLSGLEQPLSPLTLMTLLVLICFVVRNRGMEKLHPLVLILIAVWLTMWPLLMMSVYYVGPWVYLPGMLMIDAVIGFHFVRLIRGPAPAPEEEQASDADYQS